MSLHALNFVAASSQYLSLASPAGGGADAWSVAGWVKTTSAATASGAVANPIFDGSPFGVDAGKATLAYYSSGVHKIVGATTISDGNWHFIAATHDASGNIIIYVDNVVDATANVAIANPTNSTITTIATDNAGNFFDGQLSDLYAFQRVLTGVNGEITSLYQFTDPSATNLLGKYLFLEGSGSTTADGSSHANTATFQNTPTWISGDNPEFGFPAQLAVSASGSATVRLGETLTLSMSWLSGVQGPATVWTPTLDDPTAGTFSPTSATLAATSGATASINLAIAGTAGLGSHTITWANNQSLPTHTTTFTAVRAPASITKAIIPGGIRGNSNTLYLEFNSNILSYNGGATLTVNSDPPKSLVNPLYDLSRNPTMVFALNTMYRGWQDDDDATLTGGTWARNTISNTYTWMNGANHTSAGAGATATYTILNVIPGIYVYSGIDPIDSGHTTDAKHRLTDSMGLDTSFHVDQTAPGTQTSRAGAFHRVDPNLHRLTDRGTFTVIGTGPRNITVTVTNAAGSGILAVDEIYIERLISLQVPVAGSPVDGTPIVQAGDTVTIDFPDGSITCVAGTIGHTPTAGNPLTLQVLVPDHAGDESTDFMPYPDTAHVLEVGFNPSDCTDSYPGRINANWRLGAEGWGFTVSGSTDPDGQLNGISAGSTASIKFRAVPIGGNGDDNWGLPAGPRSGNWSFLFDGPPPFNFGLTLEQDFGVTGFTGSPTMPVLDATTGQYFVTISHTPASDLDTYATGLTLRVTPTSYTGNYYPKNVGIRDPSMEVGVVNWNKFTHKATYDRMHGSGFGPSRMLDVLRTNSCNWWQYSDVYKPNQNTAAGGTAIAIPVSAFDPVDLTGADVDQALHFFGSFGGYLYRALVKVTLASPHTVTSLGLKNLMIMSPDTDFGSWASNIIPATDLTTVFLAGSMLIGITSDTTFVMAVSTNYTRGTLITLAGHQAVTGQMVLNDPVRLSIDKQIQYCNETETDFYFHFSRITDPTVNPEVFTSVATLAATTLDAGRKAFFTISNEVWNVRGPIETGAFISLQTQNGLGSFREAYAQRLAQMELLVRAPFATAGRAADCKVVMESDLGDTSITIGSLNWWHANCDPVTGPKFDCLHVSSYFGNTADWVDGSAAGNMDPDGLVDLAVVTQLKNYNYQGIATHRFVLDDPAYDHQFDDVELGLYEWSPDRQAPDSSGPYLLLSYAAYRHPRYFHLIQAMCRAQEVNGATRTCFYTADSAKGYENAENWQVWSWDGMANGTGTEPVGNPHDLWTTPSQVGGGLTAWAGAVGPSGSALASNYYYRMLA